MDVVVAQPDGMGDGCAWPQQPQRIEIAYKRAAWMAPTQFCLDMGFEQMGVDRELLFLGQTGESAQQFFRATLRGRRS